MLEVINLIEKCIAFAIILQTIELLLIRSTFSDKGVWRWGTLKKEFAVFSKFSSSVLSSFLNYRNFIVVLIIRLFLGVLLMLFQGNFLIMSVLLLSSILISLRWRGTFNGGSDYMTILVLLCLWVQELFYEYDKVTMGVIIYLTIQLISSYFIAGLVKLKAANWRSGLALSGFLSSSIYKEDSLIAVVKPQKHAAIISWLIIIFELSFPLSLLNQTVCAAYLSLAVLFHLGNFYLFGLNRFIFSWLACYPAVYFCSGILSR